MPSWSTQQPSQRGTIQIHAPWWSPDKDEHGQYVEHVTIWDDYLGIDEQAMIKRSLGRQRAPRKASDIIDTSEMAKAETYKLQHFIVELTNAAGERAPMTDTSGSRPMLSEAILTAMRQRDRAFIAGAIDDLKEPAVPPSEADEAAADRDAQRVEYELARGSDPVDIRRAKGADEFAHDSFRPHRERTVFADAEA